MCHTGSDLLLFGKIKWQFFEIHINNCFFFEIHASLHPEALNLDGCWESQ